MQKYTASVITLVALMVGLTVTWSQAGDGVVLSATDEQAYQEAYSSWKRIADVQEEAGLPPIGDPPKREDFISISAQRAEVAYYDAIARAEADARWRERINAAKPHLRKLVRAGEDRSTDYRATLARAEKE